jgi:hypothetical protein
VLLQCAWRVVFACATPDHGNAAMQVIVKKKVLYKILLEHGTVFSDRLVAAVGHMLDMPPKAPKPRLTFSIFKFIEPPARSASLLRQLAAASIIARSAKAWLAQRHAARRVKEHIVLQGPSQQTLGTGAGEAVEGLSSLVKLPSTELEKPSAVRDKGRAGAQDAQAQTTLTYTGNSSNRIRARDAAESEGGVPGRDDEQLGLAAHSAEAGSGRFGGLGWAGAEASGLETRLATVRIVQCARCSYWPEQCYTPPFCSEPSVLSAVLLDMLYVCFRTRLSRSCTGTPSW